MHNNRTSALKGRTFIKYRLRVKPDKLVGFPCRLLCVIYLVKLSQIRAMHKSPAHKLWHRQADRSKFHPTISVPFRCQDVDCSTDPHLLLRTCQPGGADGSVSNETHERTGRTRLDLGDRRLTHGKSSPGPLAKC